MTTVALVGCAHIHTPGFVKKLKEHPDIQVKWVWDPADVRAQKWAIELGAKVASSPAKVWNDPTVSAAIICSETNRHKKLVLAGAAAKKDLFVEKPLGLGAKDSYAMASAIEQAGVKFQTGYFMRGRPIHLFLREHIEKGTFGQITRVFSSNCHEGALKGWFDDKPTDPAMSWLWMAQPKVAGCGAFGDLGTHALDIIMWLIGDIAQVTAAVDKGTARYADCDELGEGLLRFKSGVIGTLAAGWVDVANPVSLIISGTSAHAAVVGGKLYFVCPQIEGADGKEPWTQLPAAAPSGFDLFLDAISGKPASGLVTPHEAATRSAVMEALYKAAKTSKWVTPKEG